MALKNLKHVRRVHCRKRKGKDQFSVLTITYTKNIIKIIKNSINFTAKIRSNNIVEVTNVQNAEKVEMKKIFIAKMLLLPRRIKNVFFAI